MSMYMGRYQGRKLEENHCSMITRHSKNIVHGCLYVVNIATQDQAGLFYSVCEFPSFTPATGYLLFINLENFFRLLSLDGMHA
jgi:hypothetical protein